MKQNKTNKSHPQSLDIHSPPSPCTLHCAQSWTLPWFLESIRQTEQDGWKQLLVPRCQAPLLERAELWTELVPGVDGPPSFNLFFRYTAA